MTAYLNQTQVLSAMDSEGYVDLIVTGTSSVYNGQHIPYYVGHFVQESSGCTNVGYLTGGSSQVQRAYLENERQAGFGRQHVSSFWIVRGVWS